MTMMIDVELFSRTRNRREILERLAFGDVDEFNGYGFSSLTFKTKKWQSLIPGVRFDYFKFGYTDFLQPSYSSKQEHDIIVSPKFNIIYTPNQDFQLYFKSGYGFHSNDSRVVNDLSADWK